MWWEARAKRWFCPFVLASLLLSSVNLTKLPQSVSGVFFELSSQMALGIIRINQKIFGTIDLFLKDVMGNTDSFTLLEKLG